MTDSSPVRSPRYPLWDLSESLIKMQKLYEANKTHGMSHEVVAKGLGYKDAKNGAYKKTIACLGYYGLVNSSNGTISVAKEFVSYIAAPDQKTKNGFLLNWLRSPQIFNTLLIKYGTDGLPAPETIRYALIQEFGFTIEAAEKCKDNFLASYALLKNSGALLENIITMEGEEEASEQKHDLPAIPTLQKSLSTTNFTPASSEGGTDTIPIRLKGGRKAYLIVPYPLYKLDKEQISRILETVVTDDRTDNG